MHLINNLFASVMAALHGDKEEGQGLVEYALIIALVSVVLVVALGTLSGGIEGVFEDIEAELSGAGGS